MPRLTIEEKLRSRSVRDRSTAARHGGHGCMIWTGAVNNSGYGTVHHEGRSRLVHVLAFERYVRPLQPGEKVCHECDQSLCWEPAHLRAKTQRENIRDCYRRGRGGSAKITEAQAQAILDARGRRPAAAVAVEYGIGQRQVWRIWCGGQWSWLRPAPTSSAA